MGQDEITKAQGRAMKVITKLQMQKIIMDIACYKQLTRYILENDWKGLEDYVISKTPTALTCNIVDHSSIFEFIVAIPDVPATLVDKLVSKVPQKFVRDEGFEYMKYAAYTGKLNLITTLMGYNKELPNIKDKKDDLLPAHIYKDPRKFKIR